MGVDVVQRRYAGEIRGGKPSAEARADATLKARIYGMLARHVSLIDREVARTSLYHNQYKMVLFLREALRSNLQMQLDSIVDMVGNNELEDLIRTRDAAPISDCYQNTKNRLRVGCNTATFVEGVALRTIQYRTEYGERISHAGIMKSRRIAFKPALLDIKDLPAKLNCTLTDEHPVLSNGDDGTIFKRGAVTMDYMQGLLPGPDWPSESRPSGRVDAIGCPATLVEGFMQDLHVMLGEAAVEHGIITPR